VCIALCTIVAHNIAQNRPDSFPPYPPDNHHCSDDVYLKEGGKTKKMRESLVCLDRMHRFCAKQKENWGQLANQLHMAN